MKRVWTPLHGQQPGLCFAMRAHSRYFFRGFRWEETWQTLHHTNTARTTTVLLSSMIAGGTSESLAYSQLLRALYSSKLTMVLIALQRVQNYIIDRTRPIKTQDRIATHVNRSSIKAEHYNRSVQNAKVDRINQSDSLFRSSID